MLRYATIPEWGMKAWVFRNSLLSGAEDRSLDVDNMTTAFTHFSSLLALAFSFVLFWEWMMDDAITYRDQFPWANIFLYQHRVGHLSVFFSSLAHIPPWPWLSALLCYHSIRHMQALPGVDCFKWVKIEMEKCQRKATSLKTRKEQVPFSNRQAGSKALEACLPYEKTCFPICLRTAYKH